MIGFSITVRLYGLSTLWTFDFMDFTDFIIHFRRNGFFRSNVFMSGGLSILTFKPRLESRG